MEWFLIRGWNLILPVCRWLYKLRASGWGFHIMRGGIEPGDHVRP